MGYDTILYLIGAHSYVSHTNIFTCCLAPLIKKWNKFGLYKILFLIQYFLDILLIHLNRQMYLQSFSQMQHVCFCARVITYYRYWTSLNSVSPPVVSIGYCTHQCMALHVFPPGELLAADLTGIRPLARMRAHVPLQDALVHGGKTAIRALELLPDHCEVIHCKHTQKWPIRCRNNTWKCYTTTTTFPAFSLLDQISLITDTRPRFDLCSPKLF